MNRRVLPLIIGSLLLLLGCGGPTGPTTLAVTTTSLPNAPPTVAYSVTLMATGGDGSYTWSVTAGSLPTGLSLAMNGAITGTPTGASSTFTVQVASGDGQTAQQSLSITVGVVTTSVNVVDFAFDPPDILVTAGASVTWTWTGNVGHNVTFASGAITSVTQVTGTFQAAMPTATGVYTYQCTIHPSLMQGSVTVP